MACDNALLAVVASSAEAEATKFHFSSRNGSTVILSSAPPMVVVDMVFDRGQDISWPHWLSENIIAPGSYELFDIFV